MLAHILNIQIQWLVLIVLSLDHSAFIHQLEFLLDFNQIMCFSVDHLGMWAFWLPQQGSLAKKTFHKL